MRPLPCRKCGEIPRVGWIGRTDKEGYPGIGHSCEWKDCKPVEWWQGSTEEWNKLQTKEQTMSKLKQAQDKLWKIGRNLADLRKKLKAQGGEGMGGEPVTLLYNHDLAILEMVFSGMAAVSSLIGQAMETDLSRETSIAAAMPSKMKSEDELKQEIRHEEYEPLIDEYGVGQ